MTITLSPAIAPAAPLAPVAYPVAMGMAEHAGYMIRVTSTSIPAVVWADVQVPVHKAPGMWVQADRVPVSCGRECALYAIKRGAVIMWAYLHEHPREVAPVTHSRWDPPASSWPHRRPRPFLPSPRPDWQEAYDMRIDDRVQYKRGQRVPVSVLEVRLGTQDRSVNGLVNPAASRVLMRSPVDPAAGLYLLTVARVDGGYRTVLVDVSTRHAIDLYSHRGLNKRRAMERHFKALSALKSGADVSEIFPEVKR